MNRVPLTILVIEDDVEMRALLRDLLERDGYRVLDRPSGKGLIAFLETEEIDAVILDREMPGASGLDLLSILRHHLPDVPVVLITSFGGPVVAEEAKRRGAYRYLEKPFRLRSVLEALGDATKAPVAREDVS